MSVFRSILVAALLLLCGQNLMAQGFIIPWPPRPPRPAPQAPFPLEMTRHRIDVAIEEKTAVTRVEQHFFNPTARQLEGYYLLPLAEGTVLSDFHMTVDGKEMTAELLPADKARGIFEDIVRQSRDPALLEFAGRQLVRLRIFPIAPGSTRKIGLKFSETLAADNRTVSYRYPLRRPDDGASAKTDLRVSVDIRQSTPIGTIDVTSHKAEIIRQDAYRARVALEAQIDYLQEDFHLHFSLSDGDLGLGLLTHRAPDENGFFMISIAPGFQNDDQPPLPKDITFMLDVSGSMEGIKLSQAKAALRHGIGQLQPADRFNIVRFATQAERLFTTMTAASDERQAEAQ